MSDGVEIRSNLPELRAHLSKIANDLEKKVIRQATAASAAVFRKYVRKSAPVLRQSTKWRTSGTLKKAIYITRSKHREDGLEHYYLNVRKGSKAAAKNQDAFYWVFLEHGWIPRGPGKALRGGKRSKALQRERNLKAGATKVQFPFIKPGFDAGKEEALDAFFTRAMKGIEKYRSEKTPAGRAGR